MEAMNAWFPDFEEDAVADNHLKDLDDHHLEFSHLAQPYCLKME